VTLNKIREMSDEPNSDAVDILSELENDAKNTNNEPEEQVTSVPEESTNSESEKILAEAAAVAESQTGEITKEESVKIEDSSSDSKSVKQPTEESDEKVRNVIFVGGKTIMTYVNSTLTQLSATPLVTIKARGKRITQAVDISQFIMKRMNSVGYKINDVRIASESLVSQDGKRRNVSLLEIDIINTNV
tara:strand:- start:3487 stop:4053 length:567 start_codon:yes stop_codon:yes gene_type:complete